MQTPVPGAPHGLQDGRRCHSEGTDATISLGKPLWSLASEWGWGASFAYRNAIDALVRRPHAIRTTSTSIPIRGVPYEYRARTWSVERERRRASGARTQAAARASATRVSSRAARRCSTTSRRISMRRRSRCSSKTCSRATRSSRSRTSSYSFFQPRYTTRAQRLDLRPRRGRPARAERLDVARAGPDRARRRPQLHAAVDRRPADIWPWLRDGFIHPSVGGSLRFQSGAPHDWTTIDNSAACQLRVRDADDRVVPRRRRRATVDTRWHDTQNGFYAIGSDSGLRGYNVNEFRSAARTIRAARKTEVELRMTRSRSGCSGSAASRSTRSAARRIRCTQIELYQRRRLRHAHAHAADRRASCSGSTSRSRSQDAPSNPAFHPHILAGFDSYF